MLKKINRITKNKEFESVMASKNSAYSPVLMMKVIKNDLKFSRFGIIVSNKVSKKATKRNSVKRKIREIIRLNLSKFKKGYDVVIIVSPKIIDEDEKILKYDEIEKYIINVIKKLNIL